MVGNHEDRRFKLFSENRAKMHPNPYIRIVKTLTIQIPETVDFDDFEALMAIASTLYGKGRLSLGQAADLAGLSKRAFMEALGAYGVSVFNYPSSELDRDIENAKSYNI
jgi:predicted HTH domain antitoxin